MSKTHGSTFSVSFHNCYAYLKLFRDLQRPQSDTAKMSYYQGYPTDTLSNLTVYNCAVDATVFSTSDMNHIRCAIAVES